jgi:hypothetical protein
MCMQYSGALRSANPYIYLDLPTLSSSFSYSLCAMCTYIIMYNFCIHALFSSVVNLFKERKYKDFLENIPPMMLLSVTCFFFMG